PLGRGGMGRVYLGRDLLLRRAVALKFIAADNPDWAARERFLLEARAIARLQHPNVVSIFRVGDVGNMPYIAYEFVPGTSLDRLPKPVSPDKALRIGIGIARGLAAAHRQGVLHRDIKPANVVMGANREIKLLDFGIAKLIEPAERTSDAHATNPPPSADPFPLSQRVPPSVSPGLRAALKAPPAPGAALAAAAGLLEAPTETAPLPNAQGGLDRLENSPLTNPGALLGTPLYLAPELWSGAPATACSDVYALGLVLFELCAGQLPHAGLSFADMARLIRTEGIPPLRDICPAVPEGFAAVIDRCVNRLPAERFQSADEVRIALEALVRSKQAPLTGPPRTCYVRSGEVDIAYQVIGDGDVDMVLAPGWVSHLEMCWEYPDFAAFMRRLSTFSRLILFDKRGTGLSDRMRGHPSLEQRMDDVRVVMDAAGSERAVLFGVSEGSAMCTLFAAVHPERTRSLVMYGGGLMARSEDYPFGISKPELDGICDYMRNHWGEPIFIEIQAPSLVNDEAFRKWWATYLRMSASPSAAIAMLRMNFEIDISSSLGSIHVPTLILHRKGDRAMPVEGGRYMASRIAGARLVELDGDAHLPFVGDWETIADEVERFVLRARDNAGVGRVFVTTLVLEWNRAGAQQGSAAELPEAVQLLARGEIARYRGTELEGLSTGRAVVIFDGPARAVRCAMAIIKGSREIGFPMRAGLHPGECDMTRTDAGGAAYEFALRLARSASPFEVLISGAVKDLIASEGLELEERSPISQVEVSDVTRRFAVVGGAV
ncbi:MAG: alpha/beta fold hydrolase, partial [Polyangiaceae bacterium]|nr:alpha/beta fold hydrolase [Polyangiaceae bacterium]